LVFFFLVLVLVVCFFRSPSGSFFSLIRFLYKNKRNFLHNIIFLRHACFFLIAHMAEFASPGLGTDEMQADQIDLKEFLMSLSREADHRNMHDFQL
jgi:hypothetical protein